MKPKPVPWFLFALCVIAACSATDSDVSNTPRIPPADGGMTGGSGGGLAIDGSASDAEGCYRTCSADLTKAIDCHGAVVDECSGEEGCANAECIPDPCLAAEVSESSYGCEYWGLRTNLPGEKVGCGCFTAFVANTWSTAVHIVVSYDGVATDPAGFIRIPKGQGGELEYDPYDPVLGLPPGEVAILFLSHGPFAYEHNAPGTAPACPVPPMRENVGVPGVGRGIGFHIETDRPVVAFQMLPYGGGSAALTSATLLLPTSTWKTNYVAINPYEKGTPGGHSAFSHLPSLDILAAEDGTEVTILPKVAIEGGPGVASSPGGQAVTYQLDRGEYVQLAQIAELTGSPIVSNKPIGVWGASDALAVPATVLYADSAQQQLPPVSAMGHEYVGVRHRGRKGQDEAPPWRLVGIVDGTTLTWEPEKPDGAPSTMESGGVYEFAATGPFVVRSQDDEHPFYAAAYMTGSKPFDGEGDPEWVNIVPTSQYLDSYVFFTDPTYSETSLVVVRSPDKDGKFADVVLDCAGPLTGWQAVGAHEYTRVDLVTGNFANVGACSNGRRTASSTQPFTITVWGWGTPAANTGYVSYAYPAGVGLRSVNKVYLPAGPPK